MADNMRITSSFIFIISAKNLETVKIKNIKNKVHKNQKEPSGTFNVSQINVIEDHLNNLRIAHIKKGINNC